MRKEHNIEWITNLRVLATIFVIVVHVSMESRYNGALYADLIYGGFARFCVPVFVMISGALLLPREVPLVPFTKKWTMKVLLPFLFWSIPYILYNFRQRIYLGETFTMLQAFKESCKYILQGTTNFHFWYIYMIIGIYLFIPIIGKWARAATEKELLYFLGIWFVAMCLQLPFISCFKPGVELYYFTGYLGFLILGYYLSIASFNYKLWHAALLTFVGYAVTVLLTWSLTKENAVFTHTYYDYLRPNIIVLSAGVFLLIKKMDFGFFRSGVLLKIRDGIATYSYGIYLVHWLVILALLKFHVDWQLFTPLVGIPLTTLCCLVISFACVWIVNKFPFGKYISG
ncbi:MAG: acyltransferase family protein [Bacteroidota bacterium]